MKRQFVGNDLGRQLLRVLELQGAPSDLGLASEVIPVVVAADLTGPPHHAHGGGMCTLRNVAVAGEFFTCGLRVPPAADPRVRIVIRRIEVSAGVATTFNLGFTEGQVATTINANVHDWQQGYRSGVGPSVAADVEASSGTNVALFVPWMWTEQVGARVKAVFNAGPIVLTPGAALFLQCQSVNLECDSNWYWDRYIF